MTGFSTSGQALAPDSRAMRSKLQPRRLDSLIAQDMSKGQCRWPSAWRQLPAGCLPEPAAHQGCSACKPVGRPSSSAQPPSATPDSPTVPCTMPAGVTFMIWSTPCLLPASQDEGLRHSAPSKLRLSQDLSSVLVASQLRSTLHDSTTSSQNIMEPAHGASAQASQRCMLYLLDTHLWAPAASRQNGSALTMTVCQCAASGRLAAVAPGSTCSARMPMYSLSLSTAICRRISRCTAQEHVT